MHFAKIAEEHGPDLNACASLAFVAVIELLISALDEESQHLARSSAAFLLAVALIFLWEIVCFELRRYSAEGRELLEMTRREMTRRARAGFRAHV